VPVNGTFAGDGRQVTGWQVPPQGLALQPESGAARELSFTNGGAGEVQATTTSAAQPGYFYLLSFEARAQWQSGRVLETREGRIEIRPFAQSLSAN
jgi:hypothetical protein